MRNAGHTSDLALEADGLWRWLHLLLHVSFACAVGGVIVLSWVAYEYLFVVPIILSVALLAPLIIRDELVLLCLILLGFAAVASYEEGFQPEEAVYGVIYLSYLAYWFVSRIFIYRENFLRSTPDVALFLFLVYITVFMGLTVVFRGDPMAMVSEWLSMSMLAFYFPIKEFISRDPRGPRAIVGTVGLLILLIAFRNLFEYVFEIGAAEQWWQITSGRVVVNEHMIMMAAIGSFVLFQYTKTRLQKVVLLLLFGIFTAGVLISLSRAVWLSLVLGLLIVFVLVDFRKKIGILALVILSGALLVSVSLLLFGNDIVLVAVGLLDRFFSLESALTTDVSLLNRFTEMKAAFSAFMVSPVIGYGFGVPFTYYSIIYESTWETTFVHNGYVGLLYRHGLVGAALLLTTYFGSALAGLRVLRSGKASPVFQSLSLIAVACLAAEALVASSNNPFSTSDMMLIIATACALASGSEAHLRYTAEI